MDKALAIKDLKEIKKVFDHFKVPFFLAYGTLLGAYRDKEFLPGDKDIDIGVIAPIDYQLRKKLGWMLYDLGFNGQDITFNVFGRMEPAEIGYNGDRETGIIVCKKNVEVTIFFFKEQRGEMICIPKMGAFALIGSPKKFYQKLGTIKFKGETFLTPTPVEEYLKFTYSDWKNPLARDHGKTYFEMHPDYITHIKDVMSKNQVAIWKPKNS